MFLVVQIRPDIVSFLIFSEYIYMKEPGMGSPTINRTWSGEVLLSLFLDQAVEPGERGLLVELMVEELQLLNYPGTME